jgi:hypothetical protein
MRDGCSKQLRTYPTYHAYLWNSYINHMIRKNPFKRGFMSFLQLNHPNYVLIVGGKNIQVGGLFCGRMLSEKGALGARIQRFFK